MAKRIQFAACIAVLLPVGVPTVEAKQCLAAPSKTQKAWTYRLIDGRKCWYEGKSMISKSLLHWPSQAPATVQRAVRETPPAGEAPIQILTVKSVDLMDAQASIPKDSDDFESRWRARATLD